MKNSIEKLVRQRLVVTVKPGCGHDFSGVLIHTDPVTVSHRWRDGQHVFADVVVYIPDASPEHLAGELYIDRADIAFVQKVPPKVPHADD